MEEEGSVMMQVLTTEVQCVCFLSNVIFVSLHLMICLDLRSLSEKYGIYVHSS